MQIIKFPVFYVTCILNVMCCRWHFECSGPMYKTSGLEFLPCWESQCFCWSISWISFSFEASLPIAYGVHNYLSGLMCACMNGVHLTFFIIHRVKLNFPVLIAYFINISNNISQLGVRLLQLYSNFKTKEISGSKCKGLGQFAAISAFCIPGGTPVLHRLPSFWVAFWQASYGATGCAWREL